MNALTTVLTVLQTMAQFAPTIIQVGADIKPFAESLYKQFKGEELTDAERVELYAAVDAQYEHFMRPQSPAQPGDEDYVKET